MSISDKQSGIVGVGLDITDRKKAEFELLKAKEKAKKATVKISLPGQYES